MNQRSASPVLMIVLTLALLLTACGPSAPAATATNTLIPPSPTTTPRPTITPKPTATPNMIATEQFDSFMPLVEEYFAAGYIPTTQGEYQKLADHMDSLVRAGYYQWSITDFKAESFIIRADVTFQTINQTFSRAGCGFVYHINKNPNIKIYSYLHNYNGHSLTFLSQNGNAYTDHEVKRIINYYREISNPATAELILIVNKADVKFIIDGKLVISYTSNLASYLPPDKPTMNWNMSWGFAVASGSDEGFGTRCQFKNIDYWTVKE